MQPNRGKGSSGSAAAKRLAEEKADRKYSATLKGRDDKQRSRLERKGMSSQYVILPPERLGQSNNPPAASPRNRVTSNIPSQGVGRPDFVPPQGPERSRGARTEPVQSWYKQPGKEVRSALTGNYAPPGKKQRRVGGY